MSSTNMSSTNRVEQKLRWSMLHDKWLTMVWYSLFSVFFFRHACLVLSEQRKIKKKIIISPFPIFHNLCVRYIPRHSRKQVGFRESPTTLLPQPCASATSRAGTSAPKRGRPLQRKCYHKKRKRYPQALSKKKKNEASMLPQARCHPGQLPKLPISETAPLECWVC